MMMIFLESRNLKVSLIVKYIKQWKLICDLGGALKRTSMTTAEDSSNIESKKMKLENEVKKEEEGLVKMDSKRDIKRDIKKDIKTTLKSLTREVCSKSFLSSSGNHEDFCSSGLVFSCGERVCGFESRELAFLSSLYESRVLVFNNAVICTRAGERK